MTRHTRSSGCGGTGSFPTRPGSRAGRSARVISSTRTWRRYGSTNNNKVGEQDALLGGIPMEARSGTLAATLGALLIGAPCVTAAEETPKNGGVLNYVIPADSPPSFDAHRETTFATIHSAAPFYSVLIRVDPNNPSSTNDFGCDLCTEMPRPTDGGKTYTFKIRNGVKFHDESPLTAADVVAS